MRESGRASFIVVVVALAAAVTITVVLAFRMEPPPRDRQETAPTTRLVAVSVPDQRVPPVRLTPPPPEFLTAPAEPDAAEEGTEATARRKERSERALALLEKMMATEKTRTRDAMNRELQALLSGLGSRIDPVVRETLIDKLRSAPVRWRPTICDALGALEGDAAAARALLETVAAPGQDEPTRRAIYAAIERIHAPEIMPDLFVLLDKGVPDEPMVVRTIARLGGLEQAKELLKRAEGPLRADTRAELETELRTMCRAPGVIDHAASRLAQASAPARATLLAVMGESRDPRHARLVQAMLAKEENAKLRDAAFETMGRIGDGASGLFLLDVAEHGDPQDRMRSARAIRGIRNPETLTLLVRGWETLGPQSRRAVLSAAARLAKPGSTLTTLAREEAIRDADPAVRRAAVQLLGRPGGEDSVVALCGFADRSTSTADRAIALQSLLRIGSPKAAQEGLAAIERADDPTLRAKYETPFRRLAVAE
jgi:HEAT repeat protein